MGSCLSTDGGGSSHGCCSIPCAPSSAKKRDKKNKTSLQAAAAEAQTDAHLARIPGRMCMNGSSDIACMFTQQGRKGTNQDAMVVWEEFGSNKDTVFCGVFDGHGPFGHLVAKRVRDSLPSKLCSHWEAITRGDEGNNNIREAVSAVGSLNSDETASITMDEEWKEAEGEDTEGLTGKAPDMLTAWKESFLKAFKVMDKELRFHPTIDCFCSGTTAVTLLKQGEDLVMGNVGDSRAILGTRDNDNSLIAVQLTVDLKPNLPKEAERIKQFKGRVFALSDEPDVARVWLPHDDSPGLAMARAFGDFCLKDFGLIAVPDISYRRLTQRDEFIVLATDGVWDVLSNKEVVDIVASAPTQATAARSLVEFAVRAWRLKYPTSKVDDCAVVCLFLSDLPSISVAKANRDMMALKEPPFPKEAIPAPDECPADGEASSPRLGRLNTVRNNVNDVAKNRSEAVPEIVETSTTDLLKQPERSQSRRSLADCLSVADEDEWSALEGVSRVNTLLNLPRFLTGDRMSGGLRKRH
uniref:PPM-type phosphatase domain-containing protein n=1 Tax=Picea sitchensis TaxID=3332 RepID=B8LL70_PICSI|nr:unknown [Picea sitchensis]